MKQSIGERITLSQKDSELVIKILGTIETWMNHALLGWIIMWTLMGAYVAYFAFSGKATDDQFWFLLTYLAFWVYFEAKAVYSWLFRVYGFELVKITSTELVLKKSLFTYGKVLRFNRENIKNVHQADPFQKSVVTAFNKSFWVMGNEQVLFESIGQTYGFGMHLNEKDAGQLMAVVKKFLKKS